MGQHDTGILRAWRRRAGNVAGDIAPPARAFEGQAQDADRPCQDGAAGGLAGAVLDYDERRFFFSDDAPEEVAARRRAGFEQLAALYDARFAETIRRTAEATDGISDLQFTDAYRVPFQYGRLVRQHLKSAAFVQSSAGVMLTDLDGNQFYDLTGSYGVNVLGYDFYKQAIARAVERVGELC